MSIDMNTVYEGVLGFYLSFNIFAAVLSTVPGALVEKKNCATLERFHFLLFYFGGAAVLGFLYQETVRGMSAGHIWKAQLGISLAAGLYLGNVAARRLRNAGKRPLLALLMWVPVVNVAFWLALALIPTAPKKNVSQAANLSDTQAV